MSQSYTQRSTARLGAEPQRVIARLFLPGEVLHSEHSRADAIVERLLALDEELVEKLVTELIDNYGSRHRNYVDLLDKNASIVASRISGRPELSAARLRLLGAAFTSEYATEGAALCNPSAVLHPDQSGLVADQIRVALSLRLIGEGHVSSIGFCTALLGPGRQWTFESRATPVVTGQLAPTQWDKSHFVAVLTDQGHLDELGSALLHALPDRLDGVELERALAEADPDLLGRPSGQLTVERLRRAVTSAYSVTFDEEVALSQRILMPATAQESNGMEDARVTRFICADGSIEYRATYTAYDGHEISPRLLLSAQLRTFTAHQLAGPAARNKGMALFPRQVGGRYLALCRTDGESISLASSTDGYRWEHERPVHAPTAAWELIQVGNCGPPIETKAGWLVLTHGVGAMRTYAIGALLLDLDAPDKVIAQLAAPLLSPEADEIDGYVPSVVYSCGAILHDGLVWIPYGIDDNRIGVASAPLAAILDSMTPIG